ncbi:hypothetical protein [Empedobacter sp.]|uniref:MORN repeat-containing protein n=1 Tax=Empedobacter sp. TaxID=1927715 RepID=UPI0028B128E9|nr:hypothetical protein [Empedobacter sp.]
MKNILTLLPILGASILFGQVHINEFDLKTTNNNNKIFIELKSDLPNQILDDYQLVFIKQDNQDSNKNYLYYIIDLSQVKTDENGFLLIGNKETEPYPIVTFNTKIIESTPMIIGLNKGNFDDLKPYQHNESFNLLEAYSYGKETDKTFSILNLTNNRLFVDVDENKSFQKDEYNSIVYREPSPGYNFYDPKTIYSDENYAYEAEIKADKVIEQKSTTSKFKTSKFYFPDGRILEGYFPNEIHTGKGTYTFTNGDFYEGDIIDDEITGFGIFTWKNGDRFEGMFLNGVINGKGTMYFTDGDRYEGFFKNNLFHGKGKLIKTNGETVEGEFFEGNIKE